MTSSYLTVMHMHTKVCWQKKEKKEKKKEKE